MNFNGSAVLSPDPGSAQLLSLKVLRTNTAPLMIKLLLCDALGNKGERLG
jgi:hypothetical protein